MSRVQMIVICYISLLRVGVCLLQEQEEKDEYERRFKQKEEELKKRLEEMEREKQEVEKKKLELQVYQNNKFVSKGDH